MSAIPRKSSFNPFFLPASTGMRFCVHYPSIGVPRGGILYLHPFAEEMNKSRRMAALQSRALAAVGYTVLQIDLLGCGDSDGDFQDANWEAWQQDVVLAMSWLSRQTQGDLTLWGLRLGALLALDAARFCDPYPSRFVLWQPPITGEALLTQFLRLRLAGEMLSGGNAMSGVNQLRTMLASGTPVEIAGYQLSPQLATAIGDLSLARMQPNSGAVHWLEVVSEPGRDLSPAARRIVDSWVQTGVNLRTHCVSGQPFWNTVETTECPTLITATTAMLTQGVA